MWRHSAAMLVASVLTLMAGFQLQTEPCVSMEGVRGEMGSIMCSLIEK